MFRHICYYEYRLVVASKTTIFVYLISDDDKTVKWEIAYGIFIYTVYLG